jgi:hypothetical protein
MRGTVLQKKKLSNLLAPTYSLMYHGVSDTISQQVQAPFQAQTTTATFSIAYVIHIQGEQKVSVHLMITIQKVYSNKPHTIDDLKTAITEHIRNVDRAILNTVFANTIRSVNKCLVTGGGHFEHYL